MIHVVMDSKPVIGTYIVPHIAKAELDRFLAIAHKCFHGPSVLLGDLHARQTQCDDTYNYAAKKLQKWAGPHNFQTQCPPRRHSRIPEVQAE